MQIELKNFGPLKLASFELGDITIICGDNNTGKTYATYALYGFLDFWNKAYTIEIDTNLIKNLMNSGNIEIDINEFVDKKEEIIKKACKRYIKYLPSIFASKKDFFNHTDFLIKLTPKDSIPVNNGYKRILGTPKKELLQISKEKGKRNLEVSFLVDKTQIDLPNEVIKKIIGDSIQEILFGNIFPSPFIACAERTGIAIFRKELDFARDRLLEKLSETEKLDPFELIKDTYSDYALPVRRNVDFSRTIETIAKEDSFIATKKPGLIKDFVDLVGGKYKVSRQSLHFIPNKNKKIKLTMAESSSAVRSLLDIGFYLIHKAKPNDLLVIDEPELNLHPKNQCRIARLFARLVNNGIKIFITTHSDYIIKELNTLIMLYQKKSATEKIRKENNYKEEELISPDKIKVYIAEEKLIKLNGNSRRTRCQTLVPAKIDPEYGIEAPSFDNTIEKMNQIQRDIVFSME